MVAAAVVYVVDDEPLVRRSLCELIGLAGFAAEEFASAEEFLQQCHPERPGCIVTDVRMPGMSGLDLQRRLAERDWPLPVILITGHAEIPMAVQAMRDGAYGFLEKPYKTMELLALVRGGLERERINRQQRAERQEFLHRLSHLTPRELAVAERLVAGRSLKEIAVEFAVSIQTVARHRAGVWTKLCVENDVELTRAIITHHPAQLFFDEPTR